MKYGHPGKAVAQHLGQLQLHAAHFKASSCGLGTPRGVDNAVDRNRYDTGLRLTHDIASAMIRRIFHHTRYLIHASQSLDDAGYQAEQSDHEPWAIPCIHAHAYASTPSPGLLFYACSLEAGQLHITINSCLCATHNKAVKQQAKQHVAASSRVGP